MYENLYKDMKKEQNKAFFLIKLSISYLIVLLIPSVLLLNHFDHSLLYNLFLLIIIIFIPLSFFTIFKSISAANAHEKFSNEVLIPFTINKVNPTWISSIYGFNKQELINSFIVDLSGSIYSSLKVNEEDCSFAYLTNILSGSEDDLTIFKGTLICFKLTENNHHFIQLREQGRPTKNKDFALLNIKEYKKEDLITNNPKLLMYTNVLQHDQFISRTIQLYYTLRKFLKRKLILTIYEDSIYVGIVNQDYTHYPFFVSISDQVIESKINTLKQIQEIIHIVREHNKKE